jgi:putative endonuclease
MVYVYVIRSEKDPDRFYVGYSADLKRGLGEHNDGTNHSTRGNAWRLVYYEAYATRDAAIRRERVLKGDGRTRRHLMERIRSMLEIEAQEPFNGGERQTGE